VRFARSRIGRLLAFIGAVIFFRRHPHAPRRRAEPPDTLERRISATVRAERLTILLLGVAALLAAGFAALYVIHPNTQLLGLALGGSLALLAAAAVVAGKRLVPQEKIVEEYPRHGDEHARGDVEEIVTEGADGITRRRLLAAGAGCAGVALGAAILVPAASLGPRVGSLVYATPWRRGRGVVDETDLPIHADDVRVGEMLTGFPAGADKDTFGAPIVIVRLAPDENELGPDQSAGAPEGIIAFSKICPHAGCAVSMYRHPLYEPTSPGPALVCPCHYSTFDPGRGGVVVFGPAGRALPQLPLDVRADGRLEAGDDFLTPVGPSYSGASVDNPVS
jgi:ubiquinol-cytochrome c reductase iron-sulfur subunit